MKNKFDERKFLSLLKEKWVLGKQYYARDHRKMKMLNATDLGDLWRAIDAKFPAYQILPDSNQISYVKDNILASLYTTAKAAEIIPTSEEDRELTTKLNLFLEYFWDTRNVGYKMFQAGERASLLNYGVTQVGWDESETMGEGTRLEKGQVNVKNIDPMSFMRDPFAESLQKGQWCCHYENVHLSVIKNNPKYKDTVGDLEKIINGQEILPSYGEERQVVVKKGHVNLLHWFFTNKEGGIDEIDTIDTEFILYRKENIKPNLFPFAELYCNAPGSSLIGISSPARIFANNVAYNLMMSMALTAEYKNQHPPKFVSTQSGLNVAAFAKHGNEADRTFAVNNDAERAVHYHQYPNISPAVPQYMATLQNDVAQVTGVDGRYTGRDTGSILTTGGTEEMLNRVTMIDTPKIINYENYAKELTMLILQYMLEYSPKRSYFVKKNGGSEYESVEVDFPNIPANTIFNYSIAISSELPKNKQRVAAWADMLMEKQMQYRQAGDQSVELITPEEWLMLQDVPFKEMMLERMGFQRDTTALAETSQVLFQYANLMEQGMNPEAAMMATADTLQKTRAGQPLDEAEKQAGLPSAPSF